MMKGFLKDYSPGLQFLFSMLVVIATWLVFQIIALVAGIFLYGVGLNEVTNVILNPDTSLEIAFLKFLQTVISIGMFGVSSFVIAWFVSDDVPGYLGLSKTPETVIFLLTALLVLLSLPLNNYLTWFNSQLSFGGRLQWLQDYIVEKESGVNGMMEKFLGVRGTVPLLVNIFVIAIVPAFCEELLFRGVLQGLFVKWVKNVHIGILITALVFGFFHFQFLSLLPRFYLGIIFGYLFYWSGSLWITIFAHFINNATAVFFYYFFYQGMTDDSMDKLGTPESHPVYAMLSLTVILVVIVVIRSIIRENRMVSRN